MSAETNFRVVIFGNSGAGKTTLAQLLSTQLGIPRVDLDDLGAWGHGGTDAAAYHSAVERTIGDSRWIVSGRDPLAERILLGRATHAIVLDPPPILCAYRGLVRRPLRRLLFREDTLAPAARTARPRVATLKRAASLPLLVWDILLWRVREGRALRRRLAEAPEIATRWITTSDSASELSRYFKEEATARLHSSPRS
ncbi:MAG: hypothetical protein KF709_01200 [Gemmatimonadaceae bacterium]|nr:hypothetical protein [Gemmatimonadaceae bacterium]